MISQSVDSMSSEPFISPIFLFSLPRSGSTLLQRIIASHPRVATVPEPWLLLPFIHAIKPEETYSEYSHKTASNAIRSFAQTLPGGASDYQAALRNFALELYSRAACGKPYFLDKTPRYHVIADEIMQTFPAAKFVFLFRHPLAVYSSVVETWQLPHVFAYDLYKGFDALFEAFQSSQSRGFFLTYEALVSEPERAIRDLCSYIGIDYRSEMTDNFSNVKLRVGELGNPVPAQTEQTKIVDASIDKWTGILCSNIIRRSASLGYLKFIGAERMSRLGYDYVQSRNALLSRPTGIKDMWMDLANLCRGFLSISLETQMLRDKWRAVGEGKRIYAHR